MATLPNPTGSPGRAWAWLALVLVFGLHSFQAIRLFPTLRSIVDPESPVLVVDHAIHEYHGALGARFFRESGTTWGFDPHFMAGYPETPVWDSSSNPSILFDWIGGEGNFRAYKVGLFASSILVLVLIAAGGRAAGLGTAEVAVASALASVAFWLGFANSLWRTGLFAFTMASAGVGLLLALCSKFDRSPTKGWWCALTSAAAGLFFLHVTAPILAIGGLLAFEAVVGRRRGLRWQLAFFGAGAFAVVVNLPWLSLLWKFREIRVGSGSFMTSGSARFLLDFFLARSMEGRTGLVLLMLGVPGLAFWWWGGKRASAAAFGGSILVLMALTGFGSLWGPTRILEPLRFQVPFLFLLASPAASTVVSISRGIARAVGGRRRGILATSLAWIVVLGLWVKVDQGFFRASGFYLSKSWPLAVGIKPEMRGMVEWLRRETDLSARVLFEDQLRLLEYSDTESVHWTPMLPKLLGNDSRLFIGGLYQTAFIEHHQVASFGDFQLASRPIDEWSPLEVEGYCRTYNVGWVVCWSPLSRFWFDRYPMAKKVAVLPRYSRPDLPPSDNQHEWSAMVRRSGKETAIRYLLEGEQTYSVYRLDRPHSYFLKGKGRIVAVAPNRVELADVEPEDGAVVVSLHWLDTWKSDPPLTLKPEPMPPDPVDFVRIELPEAVDRIVLFNGYGR